MSELHGDKHFEIYQKQKYHNHDTDIFWFACNNCVKKYLNSNNFEILIKILFDPSAIIAEKMWSPMVLYKFFLSSWVFREMWPSCFSFSRLLENDWAVGEFYCDGCISPEEDVKLWQQVSSPPRKLWISHQVYHTSIMSSLCIFKKWKSVAVRLGPQIPLYSCTDVFTS